MSDFNSVADKPSLVRRLASFILLLILLTLVLCGWYIKTINKPPVDFPVNTPISIEKGMNVREITDYLESERVIQSGALLYFVLAFLYEPTEVKASTYVFDEPVSTLDIAEKLVRGDFNTDLIKFTHFEGERVNTLAVRAQSVLPNFKTDVFIQEATPLEGKLFPDTYLIPQRYTHTDLMELMLATYNDKISELRHQVDDHPLTEIEIITLASIIEREANSRKSKEIVSGILQNRLALNMPLQADASIEYVLDKPLSELTAEDLKIDSPYNTYLYTGLPPTPIGNPGLESIMAVLDPEESDFLFYITGNDGNFYYAETYTEHLRNIELYLR